MAADIVGPPVADIEEIEIGDEVSLYNPRSDQVLVLNVTASDVWRLSDGEHTLEEVVGLLARVYDVAADVIRVDVVAAVESFRAGGYLT